jgi:hypothetical protein
MLTIVLQMVNRIKFLTLKSCGISHYFNIDSSYSFNLI